MLMDPYRGLKGTLGNGILSLWAQILEQKVGETEPPKKLELSFPKECIREKRSRGQ